MAIEEALCQLLEDSQSFAALASDRIYPIYIPHGVSLPAVTYSQVAGSDVYSTSDKLGRQTALFQITCWAATPTAARNLAIVVQDTFSGWSGEKESVTVLGTFMSSRYDIPAMEPRVDMINAYGKAVDVTFHFVEDTVYSDGDYGYALYGDDLFGET